LLMASHWRKAPRFETPQETRPPLSLTRPRSRSRQGWGNLEREVLRRPEERPEEDAAALRFLPATTAGRERKNKQSVAEPPPSLASTAGQREAARPQICAPEPSSYSPLLKEPPAESAPPAPAIGAPQGRTPPAGLRSRPEIWQALHQHGDDQQCRPLQLLYH
jgi:hypothetical protein